MKIITNNDGHFRYATVDEKKISAHPLLYIVLYYFKDAVRKIAILKRLYDSLSFYSVAGYFPRLRRPRSLNEKILWVKDNLKTDLMVQCADKHAVRDYVSGKIGDEYLVRQLYKGDDPLQIHFEDLPVRAVIKPTHVSGKVLFFKAESYDREDIITTCRDWLSIAGYGQHKGEWAYSRIHPALVVEEDLSDEQGIPPIDYKIFVSGGKVLFIQLDIGRFVKHRRILLDPQWKLLDVVYEYPRPDSFVPRKPSCADEMIEIAIKLAEPFPLCRIDLYEYQSRPRFGEITFYPASGKAAFIPREYDFIFGDMVELPEL